MKKLLVILSLLITCLVSYAQEEDTTKQSGFSRAFGYADGLLYRYQHRNTYDTLYMKRPDERWAFITRSNIANSTIAALGIVDGNQFISAAKARAKFTQSFTIGYRSVNATVSVNPGLILGKKNNDLQFGLQSNGNALGGEILWRKTGSYTGKTIIGEDSYLLPEGSFHSDMLDASGYYVFNKRKFSWSAAMAQGYIQKRSAGSAIISIALRSGNSKMGMLKDVGNPDLEISYANIALGIGYGYNYVFPNGLLVHGSARTSVIVYDGGGVKSESGMTKIPMSFPDFVFNGALSVVYPFGKYFTGMGMTFVDDTYGNRNSILIDNMRYKANIFFGLRF